MASLISLKWSLLLFGLFLVPEFVKSASPSAPIPASASVPASPSKSRYIVIREISEPEPRKVLRSLPSPHYRSASQPLKLVPIRQVRQNDYMNTYNQPQQTTAGMGDSQYYGNQYSQGQPSPFEGQQGFSQLQYNPQQQGGGFSPNYQNQQQQYQQQPQQMFGGQGQGQGQYAQYGQQQQQGYGQNYPQQQYIQQQRACPFAQNLNRAPIGPTGQYADERGCYPDAQGNYPDTNGNYPDAYGNYPDLSTGLYPDSSGSYLARSLMFRQSL